MVHNYPGFGPAFNHVQAPMAIVALAGGGAGQGVEAFPAAAMAQALGLDLDMFLGEIEEGGGLLVEGDAGVAEGELQHQGE